MPSTEKQIEGFTAEVQPEAHSPEGLVLGLHHLSRALQTFLISQARASSLGLLEFLVLSRAAEGDGVTPLEVGRSLGLSSSTMTGLADRLEADGLLRRAPHPSDRRLLLHRATPKGRRVRERALGPIFAQLTTHACELQQDERAVINRFLADTAALVQHADTPNSAGRPKARATVTRRPRSPRSP